MAHAIMLIPCVATPRDRTALSIPLYAQDAVTSLFQNARPRFGPVMPAYSLGVGTVAVWGFSLNARTWSRRNDLSYRLLENAL